MEPTVEFTLKAVLTRLSATLSGRVGAFTFVIIFSAGVLMNGPTPAAAQDMQALMDRIERLERDIRTMNIQLARDGGSISKASGETTSVDGGSGMTGSAIARFDARITSIENDVRTATGSMENLDFRIRTIEGQLEKIVSDLDFRLSELEQGRTPVSGQGMSQNFQQEPSDPLSAPSTGTVTQDVGQSSSGVLGTITETELNQISPAAQVSTTDQGVASSQVSTTESAVGVSAESVGETTTNQAAQEAALLPKEQYTNAFGLLRQAKYDEAAEALQAFVDQYPEDKLAPNARYWLGETYYVRSEYVRAAEIFFEGYRLSPTGTKAPDTLLKLGMALGSLGKKVEACAAFGKLSEEFPNASANVRSTLERERLRYDCP